MRTPIGAVVLSVACAAIAPRASAQAIAPADFLPLGAAPQWRYERVEGSGPQEVRLDVVGVNPAASGTRYVLEFPFEDRPTRLRLEIATDGRLLLRALVVDLNDVVEDLPLDPTATADMQFSPPALLGEAALVPASAVTQTPVDTAVEAKLDTGIGSIDVDVDVTGAITARWEPAEPVDTPAGRFEDVVRLVVDVELRFVDDILGSDATMTERVDGILARDVGFVQLRLGDATYRLLRAVVGGRTIGEFAQYEDIVGLAFTVPPVLTLDGRASGEAAGGDIALHDVRLSHTLYGRAVLDAILDHPAVTGLPIHLQGKAKARKDGALNVRLSGRTVALDQKVQLTVKQRVDAASSTLDLSLRSGATRTTVPIAIHPVPARAVVVTLDGLVDQSTGTGSNRTLASEGVLRLGDLAFPVGCTENLRVKRNGQRKHTYRFRQAGSRQVVLMAKTTSTSAQDLAITAFKPRFFERRIPRSDVTDLIADSVAPSGGGGAGGAR